MVLILATVLVVVGLRRMTNHLRAAGSASLAGVGVLLATVAASIWWTISAGANSLAAEQDKHLHGPWLHSLRLVPFWFLQSIAAFPDKTDAAPGAVYGFGAILILGLLSFGAWQARPTLRIAVLTTALVSVAVPLVMTALTYSRLGVVWQGRYALPFAMGVLLVASLALEEMRDRAIPPSLFLFLLLGLDIEQTLGPVRVLDREKVSSPFAHSSVWVGGTLVWVVPLVLGGALAWVAAIAYSGCRKPVTGAVALPARTMQPRSRRARTRNPAGIAQSTPLPVRSETR
jgi:hypothetical protein